MTHAYIVCGVEREREKKNLQEAEGECDFRFIAREIECIRIYGEVGKVIRGLVTFFLYLRGEVSRTMIIHALKAQLFEIFRG